MRLINTDDLSLVEFPGIVPEYAILSHTWGDEEVTLQDWEASRRAGTSSILYSRIQGLLEPGKGTADQETQTTEEDGFPIVRRSTDDSIQDWLSNLGFHDVRFGYWKILQACSRARRDGLEWLWADTNCIDKTSSAELSEAINSMYEWYRNSTVCYAYLADVRGRSPHELPSSRWFTRGWTLQELLAPRHVVFFSREWTGIGTKKHLVGLLSEITGIGETYLARLDGILGASIAHRMSWVSNRTTTRPEDIAYCMLGIFDVNMPLIYGEGSKAFSRLQEEIIKVSDDHSIFAWTWIVELSDPSMRGQKRGIKPLPGSGYSKPYQLNRLPIQPAVSPSSAKSTIAPVSGWFPSFRLEWLRRGNTWACPQRSTLLAPDPIVFYDSAMFPVLAPSDTVAPFNMTNAGLTISLPIVRHLGDELFFAVLDRRDDRLQETQTLLCVPLVRHNRHRNRYTRTWFPRRPIKLVRHIDAPKESSETIEVCRDVQHVPFYYPAFGGASHQYGFWMVYPKSVDEYQLCRGATSPHGVFNDYGIFIDRQDGLKDQTIGGLLVFETTYQGRRAGLEPSVALVVFLALSFEKKGIGETSSPAYYFEAVAWPKSQVATDEAVAKLFADFVSKRSKFVETRYAGKTPCSTLRLDRAHGAPMRLSVTLLNSIPLSHHPSANIRAVEMDSS